ncbi:MAG: hypothetical protein II988_06205 [Clostridia bacterium]|nr:hypothetical protein [Clostridia bacterium]
MAEKEKKTPEKSKENNSESIFTKETLGVVMILFSTLILVCLITRDKVFAAPGRLINTFFFGTFGYFAYLVIGTIIYYGIVLITGKGIGFSKRIKLTVTLLSVALAFLMQLVSMRNYSSLSYGEYISQAYMRASVGGFATCSASGLMVALLSYPISALLTNVGSYVVVSVLVLLSGYSVVKAVLDYKKEQNAGQTFRTSFVKNEQSDGSAVKVEGTMDYPIADAVPVETTGKQKLFVADASSSDFKNKKRSSKEGEAPAVKVDFTNGGLGVASANVSYTEAYSKDFQSKLDYIKTPTTINLEDHLKNDRPSQNKAVVSDYITPEVPSEPPVDVAPVQSTEQQSNTNEIPLFEHVDDTQLRAQRFGSYANLPEDDAVDTRPLETVRPLPQELPKEEEQPPIVEQPVEQEQPPVVPSRRGIFDIPSEPVEQKTETQTEEPAPSPILGERRVRNIFGDDNSQTPIEEKPAFDSRVEADDNLSARGLDLTRSQRISRIAEEQSQEETVEEPKPEKEIPPINREYFRPPFDLLQNYEPPVDAPQENHEENLQIIKQTLSDFHINAEPQGYIQGPSITRYEIMMPAGISVKKVLSYDDDLRMRLSSKDGVRIQAPIPGKNLVGVEVANKIKVTVGLKEVMEKAAKTNVEKPGALTFALGKDLVGNAITDNLAKGPHYLVAGATGSGKSVCLNTMIISLIMRYTPEELRLFLVDPKGVEFATYEHLPHLMIDEIITQPQKAIAMLKWAYEEMERRFATFRQSEAFVVDIDGYNSQVASDTIPKMPRIVIIIDELADLMQTCKKDLEARICAIAQKARSAGIHLVLATQRPSVDVITGTIKANLPSRIAFKVMNFADSQTILGEAGAEKLLGNGDMLYKNSTMPGYERYQGAFITAREINSVVSYVKEKNKAYFDDELQDRLEKEVNPKPEESSVSETSSSGGENDALFLQALWFAVNLGTISISSLQRRFSIGFPKAGGLFDKMERMGFIAPNEGSKARKVTLTREEYESRFGAAPNEEF